MKLVFNHFLSKQGGACFSPSSGIWGVSLRPRPRTRFGAEIFTSFVSEEKWLLDSPELRGSFLFSNMSGVASTLAKQRALAAGFGTNANAVPYLNQNFAALRAQCLSAGKLFCDPAFPAAPEALGFNELGRSSYKVRGVTWKRPTVRGPGSGSGSGVADARVWCWLARGGVGRGGGLAGCLQANRLLLHPKAASVRPEPSWAPGSWVPVPLDRNPRTLQLSSAGSTAVRAHTHARVPSMKSRLVVPEILHARQMSHYTPSRGACCFQ